MQQREEFSILLNDNHVLLRRKRQLFFDSSWSYYERLLKDSITESYTGYLGVNVFLITLCLVLRQDIKCSKKWSSLVKGCTNDGFWSVLPHFKFVARFRSCDQKKEKLSKRLSKSLQVHLWVRFNYRRQPLHAIPLENGITGISVK